MGGQDRVSLLTYEDLHLFNEGTHAHLYDKLGAHIIDSPQGPGTYFALWAPNADEVSVIGDFNGWSGSESALSPRASSGIWEGWIPGVGSGSLYKYHLRSRLDHYQVDKADPLAFHSQMAPQTASVIWDLGYSWGDHGWMAKRAEHNAADAPWAVYEVHLGSWKRDPKVPGRLLSYRELAPLLVEYLLVAGFTHVEFMPVMEHPLYASWGYQVTGYFAPTARYGTPQDFMALIDCLHQAGIGVVLDWVPSHFPTDEHGLGFFDGTHLYEHSDPRLGFHPDWSSNIFNYGRNEVRSFLTSSAMFWFDLYHADAIRVDAVASMLYLDYSRKQGEWIPNRQGGRENLEAVEFLRHLNTTVRTERPDVQMIAEESTVWPMVSRPVHLGGLGFGMKWDLGWMHDSLDYMGRDPVHRKYHHDGLTFHMLYALAENYMLPLSHDEVVHGKGSLLCKMSGDRWQRFANLRLLLSHMYSQPGKKLLFMGTELAQWREWNHDSSLDWDALEDPDHRGLQQWVADLNRFYRQEPALHRLDFDPVGFAWIDCADREQSVLSLVRRSNPADPGIVVVLNFTPVVRYGYLVGVPAVGPWREILNSDAQVYGGSGVGNLGSLDVVAQAGHGYHQMLRLTLPPLGALFLKSQHEVR